MRCNYCGCENFSNSRYCRNCGNPLTAEKTGGGGNGTSKVVLISVISCLSVFVLVGLLLLVLVVFREDSPETIALRNLSRSTDSFEELLDGTDCGVSAYRYQELADQCREAVEQKDSELAGQLMGELENYTEELENFEENLRNMDALDDTFAGQFGLLSLSAVQQQQLDSLNAQLQQAVADKDISKAGELQAGYQTLADSVKEDNLSQVKELQAKIEKYDTTDATDAQKAELVDYASEVDGYLSQNDYKSALDKLEDYRKYAKQVRQQIKAKAAQEKAEQEKAEAEAARVAAEEEARKNQNTLTINLADYPHLSMGSEYILPGSDSEYLTDSDVKYLNSRELELARNEIFARHGRKFADSSIQEYFNSKSWYHGTKEPEDVTYSDLNKYEQANINLIKKYE